MKIKELFTSHEDFNLNVLSICFRHDPEFVIDLAEARFIWMEILLQVGLRRKDNIVS